MNALRLIAEKPWLMFWLGFVFLICAWAILIFLALSNQPEPIPLK